jgi:hypothetical protein
MLACLKSSSKVWLILIKINNKIKSMEQQIFSLINDFSFEKATPLEWIDLAFYFTVLHLFDFKLQLARHDCFRLDFKLYLINQFLIWINCPELL